MWRNENKGKRREEKKEVRRMEEDKNTLGLHPEVREEDRVAKAVALFREGYNCSQSVVTAFADLYGFTREQALHMSASFGGGIGRMRETCGAACGMFLSNNWVLMGVVILVLTLLIRWRIRHILLIW